MAKKGHIAWNKGKRTIPFITKLCEQCFTPYERKEEGNEEWLNRKFCSKSCKSKGNKYNLGKPWSDAKRKAIMPNLKRGSNHPFWVADRTQIKANKDRHWGSPEYTVWRKSVFERDNYKCRMSTGICENYVEAHHILSWRDYPELRYKINNGITLCRAHHPRARAEEKRLVPVFQELVSVSK